MQVFLTVGQKMTTRNGDYWKSDGNMPPDLQNSFQHCLYTDQAQSCGTLLSTFCYSMETICINRNICINLAFNATRSLVLLQMGIAAWGRQNINESSCIQVYMHQNHAFIVSVSQTFWMELLIVWSCSGVSKYCWSITHNNYLHWQLLTEFEFFSAHYFPSFCKVVQNHSGEVRIRIIFFSKQVANIWWQRKVPPRCGSVKT